MKSTKLFLVPQLLLVSLLSGCNLMAGLLKSSIDTTENAERIDSRENIQEDQISSNIYPKATCGTRLPSQRRMYPIRMVPIFINYSPSNLQSVRDRYCQDAFKVTRQKFSYESNIEIEQDYIQVASFVTGDPEISNYSLQGFLESEHQVDLESIGLKKPELIPRLIEAYEEVEVDFGGVSIVEFPPNNIFTDEKDSGDSITVNYDLAHAAKLNDNQISELLNIGEVNIFGQSDFRFILGVILPRYIPPEFSVEEFHVYMNDEHGNHGYTIAYNSSEGSCFSFTVSPVPPIGDRPSDLQRLEISSPAIPYLPLEYITSDRSGGLSRISTRSGYYSWGGFQAIIFDSPSITGSSMDGNCKSISLTQAKEIAESFDLLNP